MKISISTNADVVATRLEGYPGALHEALGLGIRDVADEIFAESQRPWPPGVPVDKGTLKKSGNVRFGELWAAVGYDTPYAAAVHYGLEEQDVTVRAHDRLLRTGKLVKVRSHMRHIGPRKARPYLANAVRKVIPLIPKIIRSRLRKAWEKLGGGT